MKSALAFACTTALLLESGGVFAAPERSPDTAPTVSGGLKPGMCRAGPLERTIQDVKWAIYACDDHKSLLALHRIPLSQRVSAIAVTIVDDRVVVAVPRTLDEADVRSAATLAAAFKAMTPDEIEQLMVRTRAASHGSPQPAALRSEAGSHLERTATTSVS